MHIGIQARFLRKPDTGIGQVTLAFLRELAKRADISQHEITLFVEEIPTLPFPLPPDWKIERVSSWYGRDDMIREHLYERIITPWVVRKMECDAFLSLYQAATLLPQSVRHIMVVHDLVPLHFPNYLRSWRKRWHYRQVKRAIQEATGIVAISQATADDITQKLTLPPDRMVVAPLGVSARFQVVPSAEETQNILDRYGLKRGEYLYHGGGLEIRKNTEKLLRAYASLIGRFGESLPVLVLGGKVHSVRNPLATDIRRIISELKIEDRVRVVGFIPEEDLPALYHGAKAFLYPSLFEGFGLPIVEAFSQETPVLTSLGGATEEVAGEAACLIDPTSETSIAEGIARLLESSEYREQLISAGKERAAKLSWEKFTERVVRFLIQ